jgi:hypothetical protein
MRLTLRTLLAYLDKTLDPADEEVLREKVQSSTMASSLVNRIHGVLTNRQLDAPSPEAAGPNDDANTIAEFLDSTLPQELTADVERRCLESDAQLAEVAASHQVLAAALAEPAAVSQTLRRRIYELRPGEASPADAAAAAEMGAAATEITPVGPADSGVSAASSRLADDPDLNETLAAATKVIRRNQKTESKSADSNTAPTPQPVRKDPRPAMAGSRTRQQLESIEPLLSGGRPSRVVPYLVSLAVAAAFFVVLAQAFKPLMRSRQVELAEGDKTAGAASDPNVNLIPDPVPRGATQSGSSTSGRTPAGTDADGTNANGGPTAGANNGGSTAASNHSSPGTTNPATGTTNPATGTANPANGQASGADGAQANATNTQPGPSETPPRGDAPAGSGATNTGAPNSGATNSVVASGTGGVVNANAGGTDGSPASTPQGPPSLDDPATLLDTMASGNDPNSPNGSAPTETIGGVLDDGGLLLTQVTVPVAESAAPQPGAGSDATQPNLPEIQWQRMLAEDPVNNGQVLVCPPEFRSRLVLDGGIELTLVGPAGIRIERKPAFDNSLGISIDYGRVAVMASGQPGRVWIGNPVATGMLELGGTGAMAAITVDHRRLPGQNIEHSSWKTDLFVDAIQGETGLRLEAGKVDRESPATRLAAGQRYRQTFGDAAQIVRSPAVPRWIDSDDSQTASTDSRRALVDLLSADQPIELSLIQAVNYRDIDVAALAARALASMGVVYFYFGQEDAFGPPGLLNQPQQRGNWPVLVDALRELFERGEDAANGIAMAAGARSGEDDGRKLVTMLLGFTPGELEDGGAAVLVAFLDDPKLSVRVMAIETLRMITGTTLEYRPEWESPTQRRAAINRWKNRVRNNQVTWQQ